MDPPRQGSVTAAAWDALQRIVDPEPQASLMDLEMIRAVAASIAAFSPAGSRRSDARPP